MSEPVALMMSSKNKPCGLHWRSRDYRVLDDPTFLDMDYGAMTHPLPVAGWRFIATDGDGDTRVFDILFDRSAASWLLVRSYE